jgi:Nucleoside-diphosphate-sugar epimerases
MASHIIEEGIEKIINNTNDLSFDNKRVLITGGSGFLGSWLCDALIRKGAEVICLDNYASGRKENTDHLLGDPSFT